jgi:hypothetical protein
LKAAACCAASAVQSAGWLPATIANLAMVSMDGTVLLVGDNILVMFVALVPARLAHSFADHPLSAITLRIHTRTELRAHSP